MLDLKRLLIIVSFFLVLFAFLCVMGCGSDGCFCGVDSISVGKFDSCKADSFSGETEMSGCHIANSCIDCYWFPFACGHYENDLEGISCVVCGFDCSFVECYGDSSFSETKKDKEQVSNVETRTPVLAQEGIDYTIDDIKCTLYYGELKSFTDDNLDLDDFESLIALVSMWGEETQIQIVLEYTALKELSSVKFKGNCVYKGYEWTNYTDGFHVTDGNALGSTPVKSENIAPGKHYVYATIYLNFYEMTALEDISSIIFEAYTYAEE